MSLSEDFCSACLTGALEDFCSACLTGALELSDVGLACLGFLALAAG
jgi:hypothetical protein